MLNTEIRRLCLCLAVLVAAAAWHPLAAQQTADAPFVPTPSNVVDTMLEMALVNTNDYLIDLGSGDGRIVIEAAKKYGVRGMGVELDGNLVFTANQNAKRQGVTDKVLFTQANLFVTDIGRATVLTMYLLPQINVQLRPRLLSELRPGTRVVSHDFDMGAWKPDQRREISVPNKSYGPPVSQVYLWYVPDHVAGKWRWEQTVAGAPRVYEARINQVFQEIDGEFLVEGGSATARNVRLRGDLITFNLTREMFGQSVSHEFSGRVEGNSITGRVRMSGGGEDSMQEWEAKRVERGTLRTGE